MMELSWLKSEDPLLMLEHLQGKRSNRKLRLFAVACCRRIWHLLADEGSERAVEVSELYAEGSATEEELRQTFSPATDAAQIFAPPPDAAEACCFETLVSELGLDRAVESAAEGAAHACGANPFPDEAGYYDYDTTAVTLDRRHQSDLIRDIFGNPFRLIVIDPKVLTPTVHSLAQAIYDDRNFTHLSILADALEEAGCQQDEILKHLRGGGEHVRGCWALDLVLGKE